TRHITSIATDIDPRHYKPPKPRLTLIDKLRQAAERGEPVDDLLKRLTSLHWRFLGIRCPPMARPRPTPGNPNCSLRHAVHSVVGVPLLGAGLLRGAAHHPQHRRAAGADEPDDQDGGQDQEGDVEPGGVVPGHALVRD